MSQKPTLYVWMDESTGQISFSAYPFDHPDYELNHITLVELRGTEINKDSSVVNIISNVLALAGIRTVDWLV